MGLEGGVGAVPEPVWSGWSQGYSVRKLSKSTYCDRVCDMHAHTHTHTSAHSFLSLRFSLTPV